MVPRGRRPGRRRARDLVHHDFDAKTLNCDEDNFSFTNGKFSPDLGRAAATCVLDSSCDEIRARDVCRKLAVRTQSGQTTNVQEIVCAR